MHNSTAPRRKSFKRVAIASTAVLAVGTVTALMAGVTPASAANLATNADTQVAVFMVPLTLLVLAFMFEVARFVLRGNLPAEVPLRRPTRRYWPAGHSQG